MHGQSIGLVSKTDLELCIFWMKRQRAAREHEELRCFAADGREKKELEFSVKDTRESLSMSAQENIRHMIYKIAEISNYWSRPPEYSGSPTTVCLDRTYRQHVLRFLTITPSSLSHDDRGKVCARAYVTCIQTRTGHTFSD